MTMPQTRHYEMKDSGVEWIGKMPSHWQIQKAKYYITVTNGSDPVTEGDIPVYGSGSKSFRTCGEYKEGPTVLVGRKGSIDKPRYVTGRYWNVDTAFDVKTKGFDLRLYYYLATCFDYQFYMSQTTLPSMTQTNYRNMFLPVPSLSEQIAIAAYLDEKCATIDAIIAEAKASIEEYKSWKASVIFETVTKGLNPNAEMKDSGVEWIGETPEHWTIAKQKYFVTLINGRAYADNEFKSDGKYRVLRVGNFFTNSSWYYSDLELESDKYCDDGDLLYAWSASYGPKIWDGGKVIYHYHIWKCKLGKAVDKMFCYYYYLALGQFVANSAHGTAMMHITMQMMNNAFMPLPPLTEQTAIVAYLDSKCAAIDGVIAEKEDLVRELENYKRSLIFEVVTGKRRVC